MSNDNIIMSKSESDSMFSMERQKIVEELIKQNTSVQVKKIKKI